MKDILTSTEGEDWSGKDWKVQRACLAAAEPSGSVLDLRKQRGARSQARCWQETNKHNGLLTCHKKDAGASGERGKEQEFLVSLGVDKKRSMTST